MSNIIKPVIKINWRNASTYLRNHCRWAIFPPRSRSLCALVSAQEERTSIFNARTLKVTSEPSGIIAPFVRRYRSWLWIFAHFCWCIFPSAVGSPFNRSNWVVNFDIARQKKMIVILRLFSCTSVETWMRCTITYEYGGLTIDRNSAIS